MTETTPLRINRETLRMVEICRMYYEKELTQAEIALSVGISRPAVSKILSDARKQGIVRIEVVSPMGSDEDLMAEFCKYFNVQAGIIIPTSAKEEKLVQRLLVSQAAGYIDNLLPEMKNVGLGWGETIGELTEKLQASITQASPDHKVCPVIGSAPFPIKSMQANELARLFSEKIGFTPQYLHAPAFPNARADKELFEDTFEFQTIYKLWSELDTVILSVDTYPVVPDQATAVRFGDKLKTGKAVGVIDTYFFDKNGNFIESEDDLVVRIPRDLIRNTERVIAIVGGTEKAEALRGALMTGLITDLIVDELTARATLKFHEDNL
ncbi:sugar-binding domain-containing protein [Pseudovibrio sp. Tun.PSC04-5.I4]|uniref:sugar-binding transcriptional regulator n=1 Tax=Pseudovibrio sp. Tun.PSC04-5.I4 TaxID=1798213 RepID=UPI0013562DAD|nr:sugar-binding domain-containing protein [Pseudovibrio sp. Tun.PSC04-5.I4]